MAIWVGTSGYNYPEWRGSFYPEKFPAHKMLPYYAGRFSTVEVNYTFYRMPNAKTIASWSSETPAGFSFALKVSRRITHDARLKNVDEPLRYFVDTARALGPKLGPLLFQLPPAVRNPTRSPTFEWPGSSTAGSTPFRKRRSLRLPRAHPCTSSS